MQLEKNIIYSVLLAISQLLFPIITFPYLAHVLSPEKVGVIQFADSFAKYAAFIAALGLPIYGIRSIAKVADNINLKKKLFFELFIINTCLTFLILLITFICKKYIYPINDNNIIFNSMLVYSALQLFNFDWYFIGNASFKFVAYRSLLFRLMFILFIILFIRNSNDYNLYFIGMSFCFFILSIFNFNEVYNDIKPFNFKLKSLEFYKHFKPLLYTFLTVLFISVYFSLDQVIVGMLSNNSELAFYAVATKFNKLIIAILTAITTALIPKMVKIESGSDELDFINNVDKSLYLIISIAIPITLFTMFNSLQIIHVLFGTDYNGAIIPMQITSILILIVGLSSIFGFQILSIYQMDQEMLKVALIGMLSSLFLFFLLVPRYNAIGAAVSILLTEIIVCIGFIYFSQNKFSKKKFIFSFMKQLLFYFFVCIINIILMHFINLNIYKIIISFLLFTFTFYLLQFKFYHNTIFATNKYLNLLSFKIFNN